MGVGGLGPERGGLYEEAHGESLREAGEFSREAEQLQEKKRL